MPNNYILLERIELGASAASVVFSNIPQTGYTDLKVVMSGRTTESYPYAGYTVSFNGSSTGFTGKDLYGIAASGAGSANRTTIYYNMDGATATANTFSNIEMYIPNYTGSTYKSFSMDAVSETNSSDNNASLIAGLWSNTAAITSITFAGNSSSFVQYSTFSLYGLAAVGTTPAIAPKASGGNITTDGTYWIHTFLSSGTFTPQTSLSCDYLVVAGGGGGSYAGGGAGGLRSTVTATGGGGSLESAISVASSTAYAITIGAGGSGSSTTATNGVSSSIIGGAVSISTVGGGGSVVSGATTGSSGGSGGGGGGAGGNGGAGTANQGYAGGTGATGASAGGGGAGAVGSNATNFNGGAGGAGVAVAITGSSVSYAGGGGGSGGSTQGAGGTGGGGTATGSTGNSGTVNTGGGAGGGGGGTGGSGGSGIVIIRYPIA